MLSRFPFCCLAMATLLLGCSAPHITVYPLLDLDERSPTTHVDMYPHPDSLRRPHREIAIISATESEYVYTLEEEHPELIEGLTEKAQEIGADAIVVFQSRDPTLVAGGDRPRSFERLAKAQEEAEEGDLPESPWTIRVKAIVYQ